MGILNLISLIGIFGLCAVAWLFSEHRHPKYFPWRVVLSGIILQLILGAIVFAFPVTRLGLQVFSNFLNVIFEAADSGARFVFGANIVPVPGQDPPINLGYIFAFRALPAVVFFSGLMALLYNIGFMQMLTNFFAKIFYSTMRLSGAESLSGAANIFVGIEAAIAVKPFLASMSRSELCAILACCFGTAASSVLAIYVSFLQPVFPNILGHLVSASIMAIPACFLLAKILVPETTVPVTAGGIPVEGDRPDDDDEEEAPTETVAGEPMQRMSPLDASIVGALDGVKMAVSIAAVLILILGFVFLINQLFVVLANLPGAFGGFFQVVNLQNILGALFLPLTVLTGVSLEWNELWASSVIIGRRLFETAIPPYQTLGAAGLSGELSDRAIVIVSYALSGFAHLASVGIFVGGVSALIPSRRRDVSAMGWKALFAGTLATMMIACVAGVFYVPGNVSILGDPEAPPAEVVPSPAAPTDEAPAPTEEAPIPGEEAPAPDGEAPAPDGEAPAPDETPDGTVGFRSSQTYRIAWHAR